MQNRDKKYKIKRSGQRKGKQMNFHNRNTRRVIAIIIMVVIVAMVATSVIPYLMA